jgi:ketosteroid isomerase-like protein
MNIDAKDSPEALAEAIERYNGAWNAHDLDAIMSMHAPDMVFENHTAGESATGEKARGHIGSIFETWPDIAFSTRRLYVREGLIVQEWTASATHSNTSKDVYSEFRSCARWGCCTRRVELVPLEVTNSTRTQLQRLQSGSNAFLARTLPLPPA